MQRKRWSAEEDSKLAQLVSKYKNNALANWAAIASRLPNRSTKQCYDRWHMQLSPREKGPWTVEEDDLLTRLVEENGKNWALIAKKMVKRTRN